MSVHQFSQGSFGLRSRHPRTIGLLRIGIGIYLLVLTGVLAVVGAGEPWAWVTGTFAVVHFVLAHRLLRVAKRLPGQV